MTGANCAGTIDSLGYNIDSGASCDLKAVGDRSSFAPKLAALAANGGVTKTHALASDSPAINTGSATVCPSNDQRSYRRSDNLCDIGAFEANSAPTTSGVLQFEKSSYTVTESAGMLEVKVVRTGGSDGLVTVKYFTRSGSAKAGKDFTQTEGQLFWTDGDSTPKLISIPITDDSTKEPVDELTTLSIVSPVGGATLGTPNTATITIADNDWKPGSLEFSTAMYSVLENNGTASITVKRVGGSDGQVSVQYASANGTAIAGQDYAIASGTVTLASGVSTATFSVLVIDDEVYESGETINLTLSNPAGGATLAPLTSATLTIIENEPRKAGQLQFVGASESISESGGKITVIVERVNGSDGNISVDYSPFQFAATPKVDFDGGSGTLEFANGETQKSFELTIVEDNIYEGNETFTLQLSQVRGGGFIGNSDKMTITILENEIAKPGTIEFETTNYVVSETAVALDLVVQRLDGQDGTVTVDYSVSGGSATQGGDFTFGTGILTFSQGKISATIQVLITNDGTFDPDETIVIALTQPTGGATLGTVTSTVVTIVDDDAAVTASGGDGGGSTGETSSGGGALSSTQILALTMFMLLGRRLQTRDRATLVAFFRAPR